MRVGSTSEYSLSVEAAVSSQDNPKGWSGFFPAGDYWDSLEVRTCFSGLPVARDSGLQAYDHFLGLRSRAERVTGKGVGRRKETHD